MENTFEIQEIFLPLLTQKKRYKLYYGGRGGGKSYAFADALLLISKQKKCRILCVREVQNSIKDSVYQLLKDRAEYIEESIKGFNDFVFYEDRIECASTGSVFIFKGMNDTNSQNVKSLEGVDYCWCFVAGTKVDDKNIEDIKVGDFVNSYNHSENKVEKRKVLRVMKRPTPKKIFKLTTSGLHSIIATSEHPVYVKGKGYVPISKIKIGDIVYATEVRPTRIRTLFGWLRRNDCDRHASKTTSVCEKGWNILQGLYEKTLIRAYEEKQSNVQYGIKSQNDSKTKGNWTQTLGTWWKWAWLYSSSKNALAKTWSWLVGRIDCTNRVQNRSANSLQSGFSQYLLRNSNRGRRRKPLWSCCESGGRKKNTVLTEQRVDSIEVQEQGSLAKLGLSDGGDYVYNLEVQGNNNYFANGLLVHNCEEAQKISDNSLKVLIPTIRKEGSEIWFSMNRDKELDPVWKTIAVNPDPLRAIVVKVNYYDNKYCPQVLLDEAEDMKRKDYLGYLHVWEGEPEQQSDRKLIPLVDVKKALNNLSPYESTNLPLIIGVDPARFGDDKTAIARRRGRMAYKIHSYAKLSVVDVANLIKHIIIEENPAIVNIDSGGLGAGICDILIADGFGDVVRAVNFGEKAQDIERFANRRAEMWCRVRDWLAGDLPVSLTDCEGLSEDLTTPFKNFDKIGRLILEPKDDIKKRIGRSTDVADALALTFAEREYPMWLTTRSSSLYEYVDTNIYVE